jgi:hypothetical protein
MKEYLFLIYTKALELIGYGIGIWLILSNNGVAWTHF